MEITREHLTLAAKAVGKKAVFHLHSIGREVAYLVPLDAPPESNLFSYPVWQPHEDPFDAWQLAADCEMRIDFKGKYIKHSAGEFHYNDRFGGIKAMEAVTLAAAEIGRSMK